MSLVKFGGSVAAVVTASALGMRAAFGAEPFLAMLLGALLAAANAVAAYALVRWSDGRSTRSFVRAILGGMTVRLLAMLLAVFVAVKLVAVPVLPFILSLLLHFAAFLAFELLVVHRAPGNLEAAR